MTLPRFGRIVPIQGDILLLIGCRLSRDHAGLDIPEDERMRNMQRGLASLRRETAQDFGYDLAAWHDYLRDHPKTGYTHPYAFAAVRKAVEDALDDPERARLVGMLELLPTATNETSS